MKTPFKRCGCGREYATREIWDTLPDSKIYDAGDGSLVDQRRCTCGSHVTAALVEPLTLDQLRRALIVIEDFSPNFSRHFTAAELLRLVTVYWTSDGAPPPDAWTEGEIAGALFEGRAPR